MDTRMEILRKLESPSKDPTPTIEFLVKQCHSLVVECLVKFSRGVTTRVEDDDGNIIRTMTHFPYGPDAGRETRFFKAIKSPHFGMTLATIYPFIETEKSSWDLKLKEKNYPITRLWPYPTMCRYINFVKNFVRERETIFRNYEDDGGEYHADGEDSDTEEKENEDSSTRDSDSDKSDTDEDNVFSQM